MRKIYQDVAGVPFVACTICDRKRFMERAEADALHRGEFVQNVLKEWSPDDREMYVSGWCGECFDRMLGAPQ